MPQDDITLKVPLDRDEETANRVDLPRPAPPSEPDPADGSVWRSRLADVSSLAPPSIASDATIAAACRLLVERRCGALLVMDGERIAGLLTERDVLWKVVGAGLSPESVKVGEVMKADPETFAPDSQLADAVRALVADDQDHLPVVDASGRPHAILSARRVVRFLGQQLARDLLNLPPDPEQVMPKREGG